MANKARSPAFAVSSVLPFAAAAFAIDIFLVDTFTPLEGAVAVLYVVVVLIAANLLERRGILLVSLACLILTAGSYLLSHRLDANSALIRVLVSIAAISITTFLALRMKHAEDALRRSEAYLAEAQRLSLTGSFGWKIASRELFWSEETYRILDYDPSLEPTIDLVLQRVHPDDVGITQDAIDRAAQGAPDIDLLHRLRMPDGSIKYAHVLAHAMGEGGDREYVGAVMDVTATQQAETALQAAQAELAHATRVATLGELTASIAHDVSQPLTGITANGAAALRWLGHQPPMLDEVRGSLESMIDDAKRACAVIQRIRALSKKAGLEKMPLDINDVIHDVVRLVEREVLSHGASLRLDLTSDLPPVLGDRVQLQQVVINLVVNGVQAMDSVIGRPRVLLIRSQPHEAGQVLVTVVDQGIGLDPEHMDQLFNAFFTTKPGGMGMGLSICRSIIEAHGGRIWAAAHAGPGATFQFALPSGEQGAR